MSRAPVAWALALAVDSGWGRESAVGVLEEALEMIGSSLFLLALLLVAKLLVDDRAADRPPGQSAG